VQHRLPLPGGGDALEVIQPDDAAELPDDGPVEWAPLVPYWSVLWRSGVALGRALAASPEVIAGKRVVELGCGLGVPSLVAARAGGGTGVLATDAEPEALELVERNAYANGLRVETLLVEWSEPEELLDRGPFDLVLAADVLYERASVGVLLDLLPRLAPEAWIADPGRPGAAAFLEQAPAAETTQRDGIEIHRVALIT
jgi:predicted nicotinamide N-methyase